MRIGVLSDTHDHLGYLRRAVDALRDLQVELVLHAGDYVAPFVVNELQRLPCRVLGIFGNNDGERDWTDAPTERNRAGAGAAAVSGAGRAAASRWCMSQSLWRRSPAAGCTTS
jgi:putative phosphoesterase